MPSPKPGTWVEYNALNGEVTRLFTSEINARRAAMEVGRQVTHLPFGVTLKEHLAEQGSVPQTLSILTDAEPEPDVAAEPETRVRVSKSARK